MMFDRNFQKQVRFGIKIYITNENRYMEFV